MILVIDNYDSFVHNLARYFTQLGQTAVVCRNDAISIDEIRQMAPRAIVLSPGPCTPKQSGICLEVVRQFGSSLPILGVCLGHQSLVAALGGNIVRAATPMHGRSSVIEHSGKRIFEGLPSPFQVGRYHSLIAEAESLPDCLQIDAKTPDGTIMAVSHRSWPLFGVQFHPESVLTEHGYPLLVNFLRIAGLNADERAFCSDAPASAPLGPPVHSYWSANP